jgi:hypothetical protein
MTEQRFPGDRGPQPSKRLGAFYGGLATIASFIVGSFVGVVLLVVVTSVIEGSGSSDLVDDISAIGGVVLVIPIGLVVVAGVKWRKTPGFLIGGVSARTR